MENRSDIARVFAALGDETRLAIVSRLASGELPLSELAAPVAMSQTAVSRHVRVLEEVGLVHIEKRGRTRYCCLLGGSMRQVRDWLAVYEQFWSSNLDALETFLSDDGNG